VRQTTSRRLAGLAIGSLLLAWGCGAKFSLPTETPGGLVSGGTDYTFRGSLTGISDLTDVLITKSSGNQLLVTYGALRDTRDSCNAPGGSLPGGTVAMYPIFPRPGTPPLSIHFNGMWRPQLVAEGGQRIFIYDAGDTCFRYTDVSKYPHVYVYEIGNPSPVTSFVDTSWADIRGIAASSDRTVYVSGTVRVFELDEFLRRTLRHRDAIWRYREADGYRRDTGWSVQEGTGTGFVERQSGIAWGPPAHPFLWVADGGKQAVQKLEIEADSLSHGIYQFDGTQSGLRFQNVADVAVDDAGFVYVVDQGSARVLRYEDQGGAANFVQLVNSGKPEGSPALQSPICAAALDTMVYVGDPPSRAALRFERRK